MIITNKNKLICTLQITNKFDFLWKLNSIYLKVCTREENPTFCDWQCLSSVSLSFATAQWTKQKPLKTAPQKMMKFLMIMNLSLKGHMKQNIIHQYSMMRKASQTLLWQQKQLMWHVPLWNHALLRFECRVSFEKVSLMILVYLSNILFLFLHHDTFPVIILYFMSLQIKSHAF